MPKMRRKADLPSKLCAACGQPFAWRKKWERDWDAVKYCSDACRGEKPAETDSQLEAAISYLQGKIAQLSQQ